MSFLLDTILPKFCASCNKEGTHFCEDCLSVISINTTCQSRIPGSSLSGLFWAASYQDIRAQKLIHLLKYSPFIRDLAASAASLIISYFSLLDKPKDVDIPNPEITDQNRERGFVLIPMPLHKKRLRWRGFNQSEEIAKALSFRIGLPVRSDILLRVKHTPPQAQLDMTQRKTNVADAFAIASPESIQRKNVFLVDDVYTTGATMESAAKALKDAGCGKIFGLALARG